MKIFAVGDIHGAYDAFIAALDKAGYEMSNPNHLLISVGDNFGRAGEGDSCVKIYKYLNSNEHANKPVCICGNHELILKHIIRENYIDYIDIRNGEHKTIASFAGVSNGQATYDIEAISKANKTWHLEEWINSLPFYYETEHYVFTHGWAPPTRFGRLNEISKKEWEYYAWGRSDLEYWKFISKDTKAPKDLVIGHWSPAHMFDDMGIWFPYGKIFDDYKHGIHFIDCTTAAKEGMEVFVVEDNLIKESK